MNIFKLVFIGILMASIFSLQACTGKTVMLKNSAGDEVKCEVTTTSAMLTGAAIRDSKIRNCVNKYQQQGYVKQNNN